MNAPIIWGVEEVSVSYFVNNPSSEEGLSRERC